MKPVIIIVIVVVFLSMISPVMADHIDPEFKEEQFNDCIINARTSSQNALKAHIESGGSAIGYEGKITQPYFDRCVEFFLIPIVEEGIELDDKGKHTQAINLYETVLKYKTYLFEEDLKVINGNIKRSEDKLSQPIICGKGTIDKNGICVPDPNYKSSKGGGCLIATATYGSELAPQVQQLRELRDNKFLNTESGTSFMKHFNDFYYSFSPIIADYERENPVFKEMVKIAITPMISSLSILNYVDMDSEVEVLGYGISLIILNLAMYVGIPAAVIVGIRRI